MKKKNKVRCNIESQQVPMKGAYQSSTERPKINSCSYENLVLLNVPFQTGRERMHFCKRYNHLPFGKKRHLETSLKKKKKEFHLGKDLNVRKKKYQTKI